MLSAPGERINHSNFGYNLLARILEEVSGRSYETCIQVQVFQPLGMIDSGYDQHSRILKDRASGYSIRGSGEFVNADFIDMSGPHAGGALYSTVEDMYLWERAFVEMELSAKVLDRYVGTYEISAPQVVLDVAGSTLTITREESQLFTTTKLGKALLRAVSETQFQQEGMPMSLTFMGAGDGQATEILISAGGLREFGASRVE